MYEFVSYKQITKYKKWSAVRRSISNAFVRSFPQSWEPSTVLLTFSPSLSGQPQGQCKVKDIRSRYFCAIYSPFTDFHSFWFISGNSALPWIKKEILRFQNFNKLHNIFVLYVLSKTFRISIVFLDICHTHFINNNLKYP